MPPAIETMIATAYRIACVAAALSACSLHAASLFTEKDLAIARQAISTAQASDLAYAITASLTTEVGPRPAGSENDARAVAWGRAKLIELGFENVRIEPVKINAWSRGSAHADIIAPYPQHLAVAALGNSVSTPAAGIKAEIAYYETFDQLKADTSDRARGKIVFIDSKFVRTQDGKGYGTNVPARISGSVEAAKRGALAVLIRSIGTDRDRLPHTGTMIYDAKVNPIPAAAVSIPDADMMVRQVNSGKPVKVFLAMKNSTAKGKLSHNVIGEIRGSEKPEEIVAIGGHLDSWDLGTGAIDDGAGIGITVAAAKILKESGVRPRRTIRVIMFANEENGLDGGRAYAAAHGKEKHQRVSECDLGADRVYKIHTWGDAATQPWLNEIAAVIAPLGVESGDHEAGGGADLGPMVREHGAPSVTLAQDASRYFDYHHTANDTLDKIDPVQMKQNVASWAAVVWLAAQADVSFVQGVKK
jgi:Zn-dependent M28 family amino/carboxypeptidase